MLNPSFLTTMAINNGSPVSVLGIKAMGLENPECHEDKKKRRRECDHTCPRTDVRSIDVFRTLRMTWSEALVTRHLCLVIGWQVTHTQTSVASPSPWYPIVSEMSIRPKRAVII